MSDAAELLKHLPVEHGGLGLAGDLDSIDQTEIRRLVVGATWSVGTAGVSLYFRGEQLKSQSRGFVPESTLRHEAKQRRRRP